MKNAPTRTTARDGVSGARMGGGVGHAKAEFENEVEVGGGQASKLNSVSGMPRSGVIRETLMPDGSTLITIAPEARRAASARAQRIITEICAKARQD